MFLVLKTRYNYGDWNTKSCWWYDGRGEYNLRLYSKFLWPLRSNINLFHSLLIKWLLVKLLVLWFVELKNPRPFLSCSMNTLLSIVKILSSQTQELAYWWMKLIMAASLYSIINQFTTPSISGELSLQSLFVPSAFAGRGRWWRNASESSDQKTTEKRRGM